MEPSPEPSPLDAEAERTASQGDAKGLLTVVAVLMSVGLAVATVSLVKDPLTLGESLILGAIGTVVALVGLIPMRWGWHVMAFVTVSFFALNLYNLFTGAPVFERYQGSSYTFAIMLPALGILVGGAAQGLYRLVGGE